MATRTNHKAVARIRDVNHTVWSIVSLVVRYFLLSVLLAALYYTIFALVVSTDKEKRLRTENKRYEELYPQMRADEELVADVIDNLQVRDETIYRDIFYAAAPSLDPVTTTDLFSGSDTIPSHNILKYTEKKADALLARTRNIESALQAVAAVPSDSLPPLSLPLQEFSYVQVGASAGDKLNPFYKVPARHDGLDIIASPGDPVLAAGPGKVTRVVRSFKGEGNVVEITHTGGYVTRYCHLGDIFVSQGQSVATGRKIATVGQTGNSLVPHLHFEVRRDGVPLDPVHYLFASLSPSDYVNTLYMSVNTGQSLD